jgi:hypothetical protein
MKKVYNKKLWDSMRIYQEAYWNEETCENLVNNEGWVYLEDSTTKKNKKGKK